MCADRPDRISRLRYCAIYSKSADPRACRCFLAMYLWTVFEDSRRVFLRHIEQKAVVSILSKTIFVQQMKQLIQSSTPDLLQSVLTPSGHSAPQLSSVCQFIHNRYGTIASQLLCSRTRWNPPEVANDGISQPVWFQTLVTELRSRLTKVDAGAIKSCCDLYVAPNPTPEWGTT